MRGVVSFHPVDLSFFDDFIGPLWDGRKVNPESFLRDAIRLRHVWWEARRYARGLEQLAEAAATPPVVDGSSLWTRVRTSLERFDHRPDERAAAAARHFEVELHGRGRPFFIAEASADRVADLVERYGSLGSETDARAVARAQLQKLDPVLEEAVQPVDGLDLSADLVYRNDLLRELREVFDLARAVKSGATPHPTPLSLEDLPWRIATLHARVRPFWIGDDVDGLETVCRAAGISAPDCLAPAWRLFAPMIETVDALKERMGLELGHARGVAGLVMPGEIDAMLQFLEDQGARIIQAAARAGEGSAATFLLRKIKECAVYASRHGLGYLEASGIEPPDLRQEEAC